MRSPFYVPGCAVLQLWRGPHPPHLPFKTVGTCCVKESPRWHHDGYGAMMRVTQLLDTSPFHTRYCCTACCYEVMQDDAVSHPDVENSALEGRVALARFPALLPMSPTAKTLEKLGEKAAERRAASSTTQVVRSMLGGVVCCQALTHVSLGQQAMSFSKSVCVLCGFT